MSNIKTLLITGAGRRFGKALAEHYLEAGWRVIAHYNTSNELADQAVRWGAEYYLAIQADLSDEQAVNGLIRQVKEQGWALDGVIHNASAFAPDRKDETDWQQLQHYMSVHVAAPMQISMALAANMNSGAGIVSITDIYADMPNETFAAYCSSKAALQNMSLSLAQRLGPDVRVNVIQPGPVKFLPQHDEAYREKVLSQSLLKTELGYQPLIEGIDYLLSASAVTGTVMRVDGGRFCANRYEQTFRD